MNELLKVCTNTELLVSAVESRASHLIIMKYLAQIISNQTGKSYEVVFDEMIKEKNELESSIVDNMNKYL